MLAAALQATPRIRFSELCLANNELAAAGAASLAPALRCPWGDGGLKKLRAGGNPSLGDAGVVALAKALPPTLETLELSGAGCGDDGLVALAAAFPALAHLGVLWCNDNPAATARSWVALARALPSLPALQQLWVHRNPAVGPEFATALADALPQCPQLYSLYATGTGLGEGDKAKLKAVRRPGYLAVDVSS